MEEHNTSFKISDTELTYVPRFIKQISDMEYGSVVTHEDYNEKLNLNTTQGDYNTEVLRILFTETDPTKVTHVKYLDKVIEDEVNRIDQDILEFKENVEESFTTVNGKIDGVIDTVSAMDGRITANSQSILNIINGTTTVGKATEATKLTGVESAAPHNYYGTDYNGNVGFHQLPDAVFIEDMGGETFEVDGIYYTPAPNSISESMLNEALRTKINRESITDYDQLLDRPRINNVLLTGNKSLSDLGIQPAGNYLTDIPSYYVTETELSTLLNDYELSSHASSTYATITNLNSVANDLSVLSGIVTNNKTEADSKFTRVFLTQVPSGVTPKAGDLLVTL